MKRLEFRGAFDDLLEQEGDITEEYGGYDRPIYLLVEAGELRKREALIVCARYGHGPCGSNWMLGVSPEGDDVGLPPWPIRMERDSPAGERSYSARLIIETPDDVRVREIDEEAKP